MGLPATTMPAWAQEVVAPGQTRDVTGEEIRYTGTADVSAITVESGATLTGSGATIATSGTGLGNGDLAAGIRAEENSIIDLTGGSVAATGTQYTRGILGYDGAQITTDGTIISTQGNRSHGVHTFDGATALIQGGTVSTQGSDSFGFSSQNAGSVLTSQDVEISTFGTNGFGAYAENGGRIELNDGSIETHGVTGHGVVAGLNSHIEVNGTSIETFGNQARGLIADQAGTSINATDVEIVTHGLHAYGVQAQGTDPDTASIVLNGGSVLTANETGRGTQSGDGSRGYALYASGSGASIEASGTTIETLGQRAYGAYAINGASIDLNTLSISTEGFMAYGVYASGAGSVITANDVDITTTGQVGDAAWAYAGGRLDLNGGTFHVQGEQNSASPNETANGLVALGGLNGANDGIINANGVTVITEGAESVGVLAGAAVGADETSGQINLTDSSITVNGANAHAGMISSGSTLTAVNSSLTSAQGAGIVLNDNATVDLSSTSISAAQETFRSNLTIAGQTQTIVVGDGSVATSNNGTLLLVNRQTAGADGVVQLELANGSVTSGDIVDEDARSTGGTDVTVGSEASWTGNLRGVRNFSGAAGGDVTFDGEANVAGNLQGNGTTFTFSPLGGQIGGNVELENGSRTTGGSIQTPIYVAGNVGVDETSIFGGNWDIAGNLDNSGTITPGNSLGVVNVGQDLTLAGSSTYEVEIDAAGDADLINVTGAAALAGTVSVAPLDGFLLGSPYTILTAGDMGGTTFDAVTFAEASAFVDASLSYEPNDVLLTIERNGVSFASVAETPNQSATAEALDSLPLSNPLAQSVALGSVDDARLAFDQLSGEIYASTRTALIEDSAEIRGVANDRLRSVFDGVDASLTPVLAYGPGVPEAEPAVNFPLWISAFGSWGEVDGDANVGDLDHHTAGLLVGTDALVGDGWRIGALAGYSRSSFDVDDRSSSGSSDNYHLGLYGGNEWGPLAFRSGLAYTWHDIDTTRSAGTFGDELSSSYNAGTFQAFGELAYAIDAGVAKLEPFANLAYVHFDSDGYAESGGPAALAGGDQSSDIAFTTLGLRASSKFAMGSALANVHGMIGWRHAFGDIEPGSTHAFAGSDGFSVTGAAVAQNTALVEVGLDLNISDNATLGVSYNGQFGSGYEDHAARLKLGVQF